MESVVELADGRWLGVATVGDPKGFPVLLFHGTPGSRLWFDGDDTVAQELGLRLIAFDRPGYGRSDPDRGRTLVDCADDVRQLADHFELASLRLLSVSGGGPFALACAARIGPTRIPRVTLVAAPCPPVRGWDRGMSRVNRIGFRLSRLLRRARWLGRFLLRSTARFACDEPDAYFDRLARELCPSDRRISRDREFRRQLHRELVEAYRQGVEALFDESILLGQPWGFELSAIESAVDLWHGTEDTLAPIGMAERLVDLLPNPRFHRIAGHGHFLIDDVDLWREILTST